MATGDILKRKHAIAFPPDSDTIDNDGDVFIVVEGQGEVATRRFLVSSKVLSLASPVFEKLFGPNFKEGKELANKTRPDIELHDDDAEAMSTLFNVLHFQETGEVLKMDIKRLAKVAIHCDKYDCARALTPWIPYWFNQLEALPTGSEFDEPQPTVEETGLLLLAAHFFRALTIFSDHFAQAQKILPPGFELEWAKTLDLRLMSDEITSDLISRIRNLNDRIHDELQEVDGHFKTHQHEFDTDKFVCHDCGYVFARATGKCHRCSSHHLKKRYCNGDSRVVEFFTLLREVGLWPSYHPFQTCSALEIVERIIVAKAILNHAKFCHGGDECPFENQVLNFADRVDEIFNSVSGSHLYPLHQISVEDNETKH